MVNKIQYNVWFNDKLDNVAGSDKILIVEINFNNSTVLYKYYFGNETTGNIYNVSLRQFNNLLRIKEWTYDKEI